MSAEKMTERQEKAWPEAIARLAHCGALLPADIGKWAVDWSEEIRPGRGHSMNAIYVDGEVFAQVLMDVYGYPHISFATLDWVHADSNEECDCEPCKAERSEEESA